MHTLDYNKLHTMGRPVNQAELQLQTNAHYH